MMPYLDYLIVCLLFFFIYQLIKNTEVIRIATGILIVFLLSLFAETLDLVRTATVLKISTQTLLMGMIVIFYPELRMILKKISGSTHFIAPELNTLKEIEQAIFEMSQKKIGALIFLDETGEIPALAEHMTKLEAKISSGLLQTIFFPNTALHDGAVIIHKGQIQYAGCKLPLTARKRKDIGNLGTRHMVAYETAERFNTIAIVVSEQTGQIRIASKDGLFLIKNKEAFYRFFELEDHESKTNWITRLFKTNRTK